jgi:DNA-binding protein HU-beta
MTTKAQLINSISEELGVTKKAAAAFINAFSNNVSYSLVTAGEALIPGIGKLKVKDRSARSGRNPRTGEALQISARKTVRIASSKAIKSLVNQA